MLGWTAHPCTPISVTTLNNVYIYLYHRENVYKSLPVFTSNFSFLSFNLWHVTPPPQLAPSPCFVFQFFSQSVLPPPSFPPSPSLITIVMFSDVRLTLSPHLPFSVFPIAFPLISSCSPSQAVRREGAGGLWGVAEEAFRVHPQPDEDRLHHHSAAQGNHTCPTCTHTSPPSAPLYILLVFFLTLPVPFLLLPLFLSIFLPYLSAPPHSDSDYITIPMFNVFLSFSPLTPRHTSTNRSHHEKLARQFGPVKNKTEILSHLCGETVWWQRHLLHANNFHRLSTQ